MVEKINIITVLIRANENTNASNLEHPIKKEFPMKSNSSISLEDLSQFTGTEHYYSHWAKKIKYTDGIYFLAETAGAFWFIDLIASYQPLDEEFQVWTIHKDGQFCYVECTDGNDVVLVKQDLDYTDFPEQLMPFQVYLQNNVLMLPSEY
jgi:hypothetical protein